MPKTVIDYSNTIIYKITCKDESIKDLYVGHTTNFVQRKHLHKQGCVNEKATSYPCKLYKKIRECGGWDNWTMEIINFFNCKDHYEARIKEQEYFILLNANLNSIEPLPKPKVNIENKNMLQSSNLINDSSNNQIISNNASRFECLVCQFKCNKKNCWDRHIVTSKHKNITILNEKMLSKSKPSYICSSCNKTYNARNSLWYHMKNCTEKKIVNHDNKDDLIQYLMKENSEMKQMVHDVVNKIQVINVINNSDTV
jgi:hypothetical protein